MINMLITPMDKIDNIQEEMCNVSREMEIVRKNEKEMLQMKNTAKEIKNAFDGCIKWTGHN